MKSVKFSLKAGKEGLKSQVVGAEAFTEELVDFTFPFTELTFFPEMILANLQYFDG